MYRARARLGNFTYVLTVRSAVRVVEKLGNSQDVLARVEAYSVNIARDDINVV